MACHKEALTNKECNLYGTKCNIASSSAQLLHQNKEMVLECFKFRWVTITLRVRDCKWMQFESFRKKLFFASLLHIAKVRPHPQVRTIAPFVEH